jgi:ABC-type phosphate/phosphonate transport system substrate-binding protein
MVCPHDTAKEPDRWFRLVQYLVQNLGTEVLFEISLDFQDFHDNIQKADIVYANPTDALHLMTDNNHTLLVKPAGNSDEVVFVASTEAQNPTLESFQGTEFAAVKGLMPTSIALHMLHERAIEPAGIRHKESWQAVISAIWNGEVAYGIIYKDTYDGLSEQGKGMVQAFATSDEKIAFHTLTIAPSLAERKAELEQLLTGMHSDEKGQQVLAELHIAQWQPVTAEEIARMQHVAETYG